MTKARDLANASTALSAVSATELGYVDGVTSAIQTQIDAKAPSSTAVTLTGTQTLTNKTLTSPVISSVINNTLTSTTGDIIYASAANTPARLGIGTTGQVLNVASGLPAWATVSSGAVTQITTGTFTSVSSKSIDNCFTSTYKNYSVIIQCAADAYVTSNVTLRYRGAGTDGTANSYYGGYSRIIQNGNASIVYSNPATSVGIGTCSDTNHQAGANINLTFNDPLTNGYGRVATGMFVDTAANNVPNSIGIQYFGTITADGFTILFSNTSTGTYKIYGWSN